MKTILTIAVLLFGTICSAQLMQPKERFTKADTLRGSITEFRKDWDVKRYDLDVTVDILNKTISGSNVITFLENAAVTTMQIDLQEPMMIDSIISDNGKRLSFKRLQNAWMVELQTVITPGYTPIERKIKVYYNGRPKEAKNAPWDGGLVWKKDKNDNPFIATACQGLGASVWWPCKDHQSDEPDHGMSIRITAPDTLTAVSNGRLMSVSAATDGNKTWQWQVTNPINAYAVTMNIGKYSHWKDTLQGEGGVLDIAYYVLTENLEKAKMHFQQTKPMLQCFEHWLGKYPFYEDSYKLVETPFLGMEHQSAIAYGNLYKNGYLGNDISGSGWGNKWDFIIVHESGHEWFGNNVTTHDIADMWVHEGFTTYTEILFTECLSGKNAAYDYARGLMNNIDNDKPIIGYYGVNKEGSGDMYPKGAAIIHTIRNMMNDDEKFRMMLRDMQSSMFHGTTSSNEVESFIIKYTGLDLQLMFDQYLRTTQIPVLEWYVDKRTKQLMYRLSNTINGLQLPLNYELNGKRKMLPASPDWKVATFSKEELNNWNPELIERNYLVRVKQINQ